MNKSKWFLIGLLGFGFIVSGLVMGYYNAKNTRVVEQASIGKSATVSPVKPLQASVSLTPPPRLVNKAPSGLETNALVDEERAPEGEEYPLDTYAIESMANARLNGDDRAPPIVRSAQGAPATAEELESPELYLEYESRQERKIYKAYVEAADVKIEMLEEQIAIAIERGMSEDELEVGIEKVRRIKEMKAQLLRDNPNLLVEN